MAHPNVKHRRRTETRRAGGIAMITMLKGDELVPARISQPPVLVGYSQRHFYAGRTVIRIEDAGESLLRQKIDNCSSQLNRRRIGEAEKRRVRHVLQLFP